MTDILDIGILGADGRMGCAVISALEAFPNARLSAALTAPNSPNLGADAGLIAGTKAAGVRLGSDIAETLNACDVLIDFSSPKSAIDAALAMHGARCQALVSGTTGYTETEEAALLAAGDSITLLKSGNFSLGVNLLSILVEQAAKALGEDWDIEVLEMHHRHKIDAPSGTALLLGQAAADGRGVNLTERAVHDRTGQRREGDIGFAVLRGGGVIGEHEVRMASDLEMITLGHSAQERSVFANGAIKAAIWAARQPKGVFSMRDMLGL